jgi:hypothetical protein
MNRQLYQMGGMGIESLSPMQPAMQPAMQSAMYNPLENNPYGETPMMMAGGGIANLVEREKYGLGSKLKKFVRNIIPNEVASIASAAAPFVAPFNPLLAAGMSGFGSFDKTGSISGGLKSAALTYGGGQLARGIGGAGFQTGFNPFDAASLGQSASSFIGVPYSTPIGTQTGLQLGQYELFGGAPKTPDGIDSLSQVGVNVTGTGGQTGFGADLKTIFSPDSNVGLETRAKAAVSLTGDAIKAMYTIPDGKGGTTLDKKAVISTLVAIPSYLDAKKKADEVGLSTNEFNEQVYNEQKSVYQTAYQSRLPMSSFGIRTTAAGGGMMDDGSGLLSIKLTPAQGMAMGGEIPVRKNQGGISELDLRAKGGYIPVGIKEKADDVPAMLSKNEFVFTADAVRGAGDGSVNKGAQKMYKLMKSLEKKVKKK